jgi:integrase/recombinase XerC
VELAAVDGRHVLAFKAAMVSRHLAPATVRQRLVVIASFFAWCIGQGHHPGPNPARDVPLPRPGRDPVGLALDGDQVRELVAAGANARDRAMLRLLADCGLRAGELCDLQERDAAVGTLAVRRGKGGRARVVELTATAAVALDAYLSEGPRLEGPTRPLFQWLDGSGRGIGYWTVYRVVCAASAAAGLGHVAPHDLRRTCVTLALDAGEPAPAVSRRAGHASMEQTVRYYRGDAP